MGLFFISGRRGFSWIIGSSQPFPPLFISAGNKPLRQVVHRDVTRLLRNRRTCQNPPNSGKCFALGVLALYFQANKKEPLWDSSLLAGDEAVLTCSRKTCLRVLPSYFILGKNTPHSARRSLELACRSFLNLFQSN